MEGWTPGSDGRTPEKEREEMAELSIGEIAARSGFAASAIRFYESEGLLPVPPRRSGRRIYDESVLDRLALIRLTQSAGFGLAEIQALLRGFTRRSPPGKRLRELARNKIAELDERIAEAERMKHLLGEVMACRCPTLRDCVRAIEDVDENRS